MKAVLSLILALFPLFFLGQQKSSSGSKPTQISPHDQNSDDQNKPASRPKSQAPLPKSGLELTGLTTLTLDPACNACRGASITLQLHNKSAQTMPVQLMIGEISSVQGEKAFHAAISLEGPPQTDVIKAGKTLALNAKITGTLDQGTWEIVLLNQGKPFDKFRVENLPVTFDVKPEIPDAASPEIKFRRGEDAVITIKNDDVVSYSVECVYTIRDIAVPCRTAKAGETDANQIAAGNPANKASSGSDSEPLKIASKESREVFIQPAMNWFESHPDGKWDSAGYTLHELRGLLSDYTADGRLTIRMRSTCPSDAAAPVKTFKFKTRLSMHSEEAMQISGFVVVFVVLLAGAMLSVLANLLLPGAARRLTAKEGLAIVARKVSDLSLDLDSRIRVPLGVERARLARRLEELKTISPDFSTAITEIEKDVTGLRTRLDIVEKLELVVRRFWKMRRDGRLPVSFNQELDDLRQQAIDVLARSEPKDADLQNVQLLIQEIEKRISNIDQPNPAFAQQLVARFAKLQKSMSPVAISHSPLLLKLQLELPLLFARLSENLLPAEQIKPADYVDLDTMISQLTIVDRYFALEQNPVDPIQEQRLQQHRNRLLALLRQPGWTQLNQAVALIRQLEENVFPSDVAEAVAKGQVKIEADRFSISQFTSVGFRLLFLNKTISASTARQEFTIKWDFGDGFSERGGWVSHYFAEPTVNTVMPLIQVIRRLALWLSLAYFTVGLCTALWVGDLRLDNLSHHWATLLEAELIAVALTLVILAMTPLGRRFWLMLKKKRSDSPNERQLDSQYLRPPYRLQASLFPPNGDSLSGPAPQAGVAPAPPPDSQYLPLVKSDLLEVYKTPRTRFPASFWVEATRITIALLIALAGLVTGAKDQLLRLDVFPALVAIFMIGFGANEVKKLFSQNP
jgi:hypothetical protein